jgi:hypothetical protein
MKKITSRINHFNKKIAEHVVSIVSTMWCAYAFMFLVMIPFFNESWTTIVMFISSSLLQLVLLPIIMVGQKYQADVAEKRAIEDHRALVDMHKEIHEILRDIKKKV